MAKRRLRKTLSAPGLLRKARQSFDEVEDPVSGRQFTVSDCLMSGLAVFGLKYPSLLRFDRDARTDETVRANLSSLYGIERAPCDTALRERLDEVDPRELRGAFTRVFAALQHRATLRGRRVPLAYATFDHSGSCPPHARTERASGNRCTPPPELAGRDELIEPAAVALDRIRAGRAARSLVLHGLRGVGEAVLLNRIRLDAEARGIASVKMEASEERSLPALLVPALRSTLLRLSRSERLKDSLLTGRRVV